jgi:acyl-CoA dehydrogenase
MATGIGMSREPEEIRRATHDFIRGVVLPLESTELEMNGPSEELRQELQGLAREHGVFAPTVSESYGGLALNMVDQAPVLEEAGYSLVGPLALNCAAPDEGNMHLLDRVADAAQRERYLEPLARGRVRSAFAMTEPAPGAGSDPSMLRTRATRDSDGWTISGKKWLITGAQGAAFFIVMAATPDGATMFLVDEDNPGLEVLRRIQTLDHSMIGGHCEIAFDDCRVGGDAVLGAVGEGFRHAQVRLAPARLTHCMRWLGIARRSLDLALEHVKSRSAFGSQISELGLAQGLIADSVIDIEASRALIGRACVALDAGDRGTRVTSIAKVFVSEAVGRVVDRSVQLSGGLGVTREGPLGQYLNEVRAFRIYDGPSETHRWSIARREIRVHDDEHRSDER